MRFFPVLVVPLLLSAAPAAPQAPGSPALPAGMSRRVLLDNDVALVARLTYAPGARETLHTHPFSAVVVQLDPGEVEMALGEKKSAGSRTPGFAWFIPREVRHAGANVGERAFDQVTVALRSGAGVPETAVPPPPSSIHRTPVLENPETRVVLVALDPGAREEPHVHTVDLVLVPLDAGRLWSLLGEKTSTTETKPGEIVFLPRNVTHAVGNDGTEPLRFVSVAIK